MSGEAELAGSGAERRARIAANLAAVRARIAAACVAAGRDPAGVTLVAVTKTYPAADVLHLAALGVREVGENRDQEAAAKAQEVRAAGAQVHWHFVGQLQRNKCRSVVTYADMVHSVDGVRLAQALGDAAQRHRDQPLDTLVQVSLDGDPARGGAIVTDGPGIEPEQFFDRVADTVAGHPALQLRGVMAVAPLGVDPARAFEVLAAIVERLRVRYPTATVVSAGMSDDLVPAIAHGATHVRIGSALLGNRSYVR